MMMFNDDVKGDNDYAYFEWISWIMKQAARRINFLKLKEDEGGKKFETLYVIDFVW